MIILLHSSKTMRAHADNASSLHTPEFIKEATQLDAALKQLSPAQLQKVMKISPSLAQKTHELIAAWTTNPQKQSSAIDSFIGDIYSGLQAPSFSAADREHADTRLRILSGLYGILRPLDGICPYRLEMAYKLPGTKHANLYKFWGSSIAESLPPKEPIINLSSDEYSRTVLPFVDPSRVTTPQFLTVNPKTKKPTFVAVHAKIARGAFARWLIINRITNPSQLASFQEIGYQYDKGTDSPANPIFVCKEFGGKGLSMKKQNTKTTV